MSAMSFEEELARIGSLDPGRDALEELRQPFLQSSYQEIRLKALETAAHHFYRLAEGWRGLQYSSFAKTQLLLAYRDWLVARLTVGDIPPGLEEAAFRLLVETIVVEALAGAPMRKVRPEQLTEEYLAPFQRVLECYLALPPWYDSPTPIPFYELFEGFWSKLLRKGALGIAAAVLKDPRGINGELLPIAAQSQPLIDEICAWLAARKAGEPLFDLITVYGFSKTRAVVARLFWEMVLNCSICVDSESARAFLEDPVRWVLEHASLKLSAPVFLAHHTMCVREIDGERCDDPYRVPGFVREGEDWRRLRRRAGLED